MLGFADDKYSGLAGSAPLATPIGASAQITKHLAIVYQKQKLGEPLAIDMRQ
jgi:hypothetical protein